MAQREKYDCSEFNSYEEFKRFDAVEYFVPKENKDVKEIKSEDDIEEFDNGVTETPKKENKIIDVISKAKDKIIESTSSLAVNVSVTTATVIAGSAVVITTVLNPSPTWNVIALDVGVDYISYEVDVSNIEEGRKYYLELKSGVNTYQEEVKENGTIKKLITGLRPYSFYQLRLIGDSGLVGGYTTYESTTFIL